MSKLFEFIGSAIGHQPRNLALFERALTHGSHGGESYERLEFLGDRVLGLVIADWLYQRFPDEPEGMMSLRYNALVARETCAEVGRRIGVPAEIRLGRQAREDRATRSDNVVGDVVEALIGALYLDSGLKTAAAFIRSHWSAFLDNQRQAPMHPKSSLQEMAAAKNWSVPIYDMIGRSGAHHAPTFRVRVSVRGGGEAEAEGPSKQDAETAAAEALLGKLQ